MTILQACLNYLDINEVRFTHTRHPVAYTAKETAAAEFMSPHRMAKTVVLQSTDNNYLIAVVPANSYVDLQLVRTALGVRNVRKVRESELLLLFPHAEVGAMPPLTALTHVPVYLDCDVANQEFIAFPAGTHRDSIHMRVADYIRITEPIIGNFSRPDYWEQSLAMGF